MMPCYACVSFHWGAKLKTWFRNSKYYCATPFMVTFELSQTMPLYCGATFESRIFEIDGNVYYFFPCYGIFARVKHSFRNIVEELSRQNLRKMEAKVPDWAGKELEYPTSLSIEQCSSSQTAQYKAVLVKSLQCKRIADLTGGLGVDCAAFASVCDAVLYNEINPELGAAVENNFAKLGISSVKFSCAELTPESLGDILGDFQPDLIFLDPARRSALGSKVFRLKDCTPNVLFLEDALLAAAPHLLLKLSPMADISLLASEMGPRVSQIHIVGSDGECKELLALLDRSSHDEYSITVHEGDEDFSFLPSQERAARCEFSLEGEFLYEPSKALSKSGAFRLIGERFGLKTFGSSSHLYLSNEPKAPLGKWFQILDIQHLDKRSMSAIGKQYPKAEVTARGLPLSSEQLRQRLGVKGGGDNHIFGLHSDLSGENILVVSQKIADLGRQ